MTRPNVLLVVLDAVRSDHTSLGGHDRPTTPALEQFADRATYYEWAYAPSNWSLPSHASLFTGYDVPEHRATVQYDTIEPGHTIWERLRDDHDYDTGVFSQNEFITADEYGLARGFETVVDRQFPRKVRFPAATDPFSFGSPNPPFAEYLRRSFAEGKPLRSLANYLTFRLENYVLRHEQKRPWLPELPARPQYRSPAMAHTETFLDWVDDRDGPWGACLNFMDANTVYYPWAGASYWGGTIQDIVSSEIDHLRWDFYSGRQPWWKLRALEPRYDGGIRRADAALDRLLEALEGRDVLDDTLVVVTSDHGEGLADRSRVRPGFRIASHFTGLHEGLLRVPLVVRAPGQDDPETVRTPVSLSRFPDVVDRALAGDAITDAFASGEPVVAAADHDRLYKYVVANEEWGLADYEGDIDVSRFTGRGRVVYEESDGVVHKHATWGEDAATVRLDGACEVVESDAREGVATTFDRFADRGVRENTDELASVDEETLERLRNLGYT